MDVEATVDELVEKLTGFYGTVESGAVLLQQLYSTKQWSGESITAYSARLQLLVDRAECRGGGITHTSKDETLRVVFWKGLGSGGLKKVFRERIAEAGYCHTADQLQGMPKTSKKEMLLQSLAEPGDNTACSTTPFTKL